MLPAQNPPNGSHLPSFMRSALCSGSAMAVTTPDRSSAENPWRLATTQPSAGSRRGTTALTTSPVA